MNQSQVAIQFLPILTSVKAQWTFDKSYLVSVRKDPVPQMKSRIDSHMVAIVATIFPFNLCRW